MKRSFKVRLKLLIYPQFQLQLVLGNIILLFAILGSVYYSVSFSFKKMITNGISAGLAPDHPYFKLLDFQHTQITKNLVISFVVGTVLSTIWMLLLSNKLAGPILRLKSYFKKLGPSNYAPVSFRKSDFFYELPALINEAFERVLSAKKND